MPKFVISGGNHSGKTTIINVLKNQGFEVIPEAARIVIKEESAKKNGLTPKKNLYKLQLKILEKQLILEQEHSNNIIFLDRSLVDGVVYLKIGGYDIPEKFIRMAKGRYHRNIFFLQMLPQYQKDTERWEEKHIAKKIHELIKSTYIEYGYRIISIPVMNVEDRVNLIKKYVKNLPPEK